MHDKLAVASNRTSKHIRFGSFLSLLSCLMSTPRLQNGRLAGHGSFGVILFFQKGHHHAEPSLVVFCHFTLLFAIFRGSKFGIARTCFTVALVRIEYPSSRTAVKTIRPHSSAGSEKKTPSHFFGGISKNSQSMMGSSSPLAVISSR